jgi:hypothetical protein
MKIYMKTGIAAFVIQSILIIICLWDIITPGYMNIYYPFIYITKFISKADKVNDIWIREYAILIIAVFVGNIAYSLFAAALSRHITNKLASD